MTNHETIKIFLGMTLTLASAFIFYKYKAALTEEFGPDSYYLLLAYAAIVPPYFLNKIYDFAFKLKYDRDQKALANEIDKSDAAFLQESKEIKEALESKNNKTQQKINKFKQIEQSKKTLGG